MDQHKGRCQCGDVQLIANGIPYRVGICHCGDCRRHHGAMFYAAAVFSEDAVMIIGTTHNYLGRHFCPKCGSSVFANSDDEIEIHLGILDDASKLVPTYESWSKHRAAWLPDFPDTRCYQMGREGNGRIESET